jgi:dienelactone hydrolase
MRWIANGAAIRRCIQCAQAFLLALALALASPLAAAAPAVPRSALVREPLRLPVVLDGGQAVELEALLVRPAGDERLPLALLTHGSPRAADARRRMSAAQLSFQAEELARRGYVAVVVMRRGFGSSEGRWQESSGRCEAPDHERAARESARDLRAALQALAKRPDVDAARIVAIGQSAGGIGTLALSADAPPGLRAVVNFAGGRGSKAPHEICGADRLIAAYAALGKTARVPSLWIYAENDTYFAPALARRMFTAYSEQGGIGEFKLLPAFADEGHALFSRRGGVQQWRPLLDAFLRKNELPTWDEPPHEPPVARLPSPPELASQYREQWERYLQASDHKAFAISPTGRFAWRSGLYSGDAAGAAALADCGLQSCRLHSQDDTLVHETVVAR